MYVTQVPSERTDDLYEVCLLGSTTQRFTSPADQLRQAVPPCARTVRAALKRVGAVAPSRVTSGRQRTWVSFADATAEATEELATILRGLWNDGASRVRVVHTGTIVVYRKSYYTTFPVNGD